MKKSQKSKVVSHLKGDIKNFKKEAQEDMELIKKLKPSKNNKKEQKIADVMHEDMSLIKNIKRKSKLPIKKKK